MFTHFGVCCGAIITQQLLLSDSRQTVYFLINRLGLFILRTRAFGQEILPFPKSAVDYSFIQAIRESVPSKTLNIHVNLTVRFYYPDGSIRYSWWGWTSINCKQYKHTNQKRVIHILENICTNGRICTQEIWKLII